MLQALAPRDGVTGGAAGGLGVCADRVEAFAHQVGSFGKGIRGWWGPLDVGGCCLAYDAGEARATARGQVGAHAGDGLVGVEQGAAASGAEGGGLGLEGEGPLMKLAG